LVLLYNKLKCFISVSTNFKSGLSLPKTNKFYSAPEAGVEDKSWNFVTAQSSTDLVRYQVCKFSKGRWRTLYTWSM